uniref:glycoside hydrolase family 16 protein n=1 Tax=Alloprevotella sp. TaxID=1872471 RepID=UPI003FF15639
MKIKHYIALAALTMPLAAGAQSIIDFETTETQGASHSVFDTWEDSPFRTNKLKGNVKIVNNPYKVVDEITQAGNTSEKVLAFQRSRYGSNTFGVRVGLKTPIRLTPQTQYVHVKMYTPKTGHIMLFALGRRDDRPDQTEDIVQVEANCISTLKANKWCDAVFAISSAPGVSIHSLLIAPDVQSTHDLNDDFAVYVDDIEVNNSSTPSIQYGVYPLNFEKTAQSDRTGSRYTQGIKLKSGDGEQTIAVPQKSNRLMYQDLLASSIKAKAGERVSASVDYIGGWMHAYVYLDKNNDGKFDLTLNDNGTPGETSDVMSYSVYQNKNSAGNSASGNNKNLPDFNIPQGLTPGFYRLRYKIDWDNIDAGGNAGDAQGNNSIKSNGGVIVDTRLNIHGEKVNISRGLSSEGTNGEMLMEDGSTFVKHEIEFGKPYTIKFKPANNFKLGKFTIRHGYNVEKNDSLVNETPQYSDVVIPAYMAKDNTYTIPAEYVDGDIVITPTFISADNGGATTEKYAINFDKDLTINRPSKDRAFKSLSFNTTSSTITQKLNPTNDQLVYQDFSNKNIYVKDGDVITTNIGYQPNGSQYMHAYLYVDLDGDGTFNTSVKADGTPAFDGEMLSYTYANGKNSKGQSVGVNDNAVCCWGATNSVPQFSLPAGLPKGQYRARVKIDWDNVDPAGTYGKNYTGNFINNNAGYVVDFNFNVVDEYPKVKLDVQTVDGSIVGAGNTGLPEYIMKGQDINVMAVGLDNNYVANAIVVRHGKNLNGKQTIDGVQQWEESTVNLTNGNGIIPGEMVDGDVRLSATFDNNGSEYNLVFADEFDSEDKSQPNSQYWSRSTRENPTWKRFCAQTVAGQEKTGWIEDGKLVLKCVKNTFGNELDGNGNKQQMISGAVESSNKVTFTYGKVEGRIKNIGHSGNFPAFWMMPNKATYGGWPYSGEIDIWEQINADVAAFQTIHTKWANSKNDGADCMNKPNDPRKSNNTPAALDEYHTFGLEWTEDILKWFIDGKQVFSYARKTGLSESDSKAQWPYDQPFYIILNQSVGNGGWAATPDVNFEYETKFDWVRVYQKEGGDCTAINTAQTSSDVDIYAYPGKVRIVSAKPAHVSIVDLQGRVVFAQNVQGNENVYLPSGVYVANGKKVLVP